jgi:hypothetical protein
MRRLRPIVLSLLTIALAACASLPAHRADCVAFTHGAGMCLLPPSALPAVEAAHLVQLDGANRHESFIGHLHIDHATQRMAALSLFGSHLFTVSWDGHAIDGGAANAKLKPAMLVAMLQLAVADPAVLRTQLYGFALSEQTTPDHSLRELRRHGQLAVRIERRGATLATSTLDISVPRAQLHLHLKPL